jgi:hypothetical protein
MSAAAVMWRVHMGFFSVTSVQVSTHLSWGKPIPGRDIIVANHIWAKGTLEIVFHCGWASTATEAGKKVLSLELGQVFPREKKSLLKVLYCTSWGTTTAR